MTKLRHSTGIFAVLCVVIGLNGGCLSLSMLNRENADTKDRIDALERRVSALEAANASRPIQSDALEHRVPALEPGNAPQNLPTIPRDAMGPRAILINGQ
jgi:BMFP domain-containing protein YqiC